MMKKTVLLLFVSFFMGMGSYSFAQNSENPELNFSADLMSRYIWRGTQFGGNSPSLQPSLTCSYKGWELGAWGAYSLDGNNASQEFDLYISKNLIKDLFTLTVTDYYFPVEGSDYNYFEFNNHNTGHVLESSLSFNGSEKIPFGFLFAVNFWGADAAALQNNPNAANFNQKSGLQYSSYAEINYSHQMSNKVQLDAFLGFNLNSPEKANTTTGFQGETGYYGSKSGVVNLGFSLSKEVAITDKFSLPCSASLITNPVDEKIYFVLGISF